MSLASRLLSTCYLLKNLKLCLSTISKLNIKNAYHLVLVLILTSFPCFCRNSISCCVKVVIEIDFTLWGGFKPRLKEEARSILSVFRKFVIIQSLLTLQTEVNSSQNCIQSVKSNNWILEDTKVAHANSSFLQTYEDNFFWNLYLFPQTCSSFPLYLSFTSLSLGSLHHHFLPLPILFHLTPL